MSGVDAYRSSVTASDLVSFRVRIRESDLLIRGDRDLEVPAREALSRYRREIEDYLFVHPGWGRSLLPVPTGAGAPPIVAAMTRAAAACGVGPMAAVAGALAWFVGKELSALASEVIVENGGDIYLDCRRERTILVRAGDGSPFAGRIGLRIPPGSTPIGIATSSGTGGRSLSWGKTSAAVVVAEDSIIADGAATALGNRVRSSGREIVESAVESVAAMPSVIGCLVVCGNLFAVRGEIKLIDLGEDLPVENNRIKAVVGPGG